MRGIFALFAILLVAPTAPLASQDVPTAPPPALLDIGADQPGRMTVPVNIGGAGPYAFTIDTGAERTVISRELAGTLRLAAGRSIRMTSMTGSSSVATVVIPAISVSTASQERIEAPALDGRHLGALGLIGIDALRDHAVSIDFDRNTMAIVPSIKRRRHTPARSDEIVIVAKSLLGQLVVTDAYYRGQRVRVILDTGSVVSVGNMALRRRAAGGRRPLQPVSLTSVTGGTLVADYAQVEQLKIGDVTFNNLPIAFADAAPFRRLGLDKQPAMLLGMDAMRQFRRVDIDFANREVRLTLPRGHG